MLRPRPRKAILAWLIVALALASLVIGRPLHEALHLSAPGSVLAAQTAEEPAPDSPAPEAGSHGGSCVWCLLHVQALHTATEPADVAQPAAHAAAPLDGLRTALPEPAEVHAPPPRGPPAA